jgi:hypothetical protein
MDVGTTVMKYGETVDEVLRQIRNALIDAFPLQADSDVGLIHPTRKIGKIFKTNITWKYRGGWPVLDDVVFAEATQCDVGLPIAVAALFGDAPENGWVGCIHLS